MNKECPLCRSTDAKAIFTKDGTPHHRCHACGLVFAQPVHNGNLEVKIEDFEPAFLQYLRPSIEDRPNFERTRQWLEKMGLERGQRILDVGCGSGKWVRHLRDEGYQSIGIEPSRPLFDMFLKDDPGFLLADLSQYQVMGGSTVDVVTMFDVIEHVSDPLANFRRAADCLDQGGLFFVSTPDAGSLWARGMGKRWHHYCRYHLSLLGVKQLEACGASTGFSMRGQVHLPRYRSASYLIRYLFEFALRTRAPRIPKFLDRIFWRMNLGDIVTCCFVKGRVGSMKLVA